MLKATKNPVIKLLFLIDIYCIGIGEHVARAWQNHIHFTAKVLRLLVKAEGMAQSVENEQPVWAQQGGKLFQKCLARCFRRNFLVYK